MNIGPNGSLATVHTASVDAFHLVSIVGTGAGTGDLYLNSTAGLASTAGTGTTNQGARFVWMAIGDTLDYVGPAAELHMAILGDVL